jgi:pyruvate dehydrogenase E2 component (dihydrolipoamide acetyltransferase)
MMNADAAIVMPKLGLTMTEGLLASWRVAAGDEVKRGDVLFVVETEKAANEIVAEADGRIRDLLIGEGETAPVGAAVATWVAASLSSQAPIAPQTAQVDELAEPPASPALATKREPGARVVATPLARRHAKAQGIDLGEIVGSGPGGRIKAADVSAAIARGRQDAGAATAATLRAPPEEWPSHADGARAASATEKAVARRMAESKQTIPHFYLLAEADVTSLLDFRAKMNRDETRPRLGVTHFTIAAVARSLADVPDSNRIWRDEAIVVLSQVDIGLAVDAERGLTTPVLRQANRLGLDEIAAAVADLARKAREGALTAEDLEGGALSISNVGMHGASHLVPIINPGQSAIIGVGAVRPAFRPDNAGAPTLRQELGLVMSCDHRVWDGARAARFLNSVTQLLGNPLLMLR